MTLVSQLYLSVSCTWVLFTTLDSSYSFSVVLIFCPIRTTGMISNIPKGMVTDQFGMIGLLTFIRAAETEPNLVTLALGRLVLLRPGACIVFVELCD